MAIMRQLLKPSRKDAEPLKRSEKMAMLHLMYSATTLMDLQEDLRDRLGMVQDGEERLKLVAAETDELLEEIRVTIPEKQRIGMQHTAEDYEMRLSPKATPTKNNVILTVDEFKELVDSAREKCRECADDDEECKNCPLFRLLTSILPMEEYHALHLCPYNLGKWVN